MLEDIANYTHVISPPRYQHYAPLTTARPSTTKGKGISPPSTINKHSTNKYPTHSLPFIILPYSITAAPSPVRRDKMEYHNPAEATHPVWCLLLRPSSGIFPGRHVGPLHLGIPALLWATWGESAVDSSSSSCRRRIPMVRSRSLIVVTTSSLHSRRQTGIQMHKK